MFLFTFKGAHHSRVQCIGSVHAYNVFSDLRLPACIWLYMNLMKVMSDDSVFEAEKVSYRYNLFYSNLFSITVT
jgi:hypothetical protein